MLYRHRVLGLLFLLSIITYLDRVCISVAGPAMQGELGITPSQWGWVVGVFAISYAAFEIPSGSLGDRIGPRKVLTRIVIWWSVFTSLTGLARSYWFLLPVRFFFGAGEAGAYPNASSSISKWFPVAERARAHGTVWMASRVGGALSPLIVLPIQQAYGWRMSFYVFGVLGIIWAAVWYWWYRDRPSEKEGVTQAEIDVIATSPSKVHHGLPWGIALRSGNLWAIMLMYFTYCFGSFFFLSWLHTFLANGRGFNTKDQMFTALPFVFGGIANFTGGLTSDFMVRKYGLKIGRRVPAMIGLGAASFFTVLTLFTEDKMLSLVFLALSYAGSDFMLPIAWAVCLDIGKKYAGAVTGTMNTAGQIGSFLTSLSFGYLVTWALKTPEVTSMLPSFLTPAQAAYHVPLIPIAIMLGISALIWVKIDPTRELIPE